MYRGLYVSATALVNNSRKIDIVSNNIANINTVSYKKDLYLSESFEDTLLSKLGGGATYDNIAGFKRLDVSENNGFYDISTNAGYIKIKTPFGESYHDKVEFAVGEDGYLRTFTRDNDGSIISEYGNEIMGNNGRIYVGEGELSINEDGRVYVDGKFVDGLIQIPHPSVIGTMSSGIRVSRIETNFEQGQLMRTGNTLDFALDNEGFFEVSTEDGTRYTRDGSFKLNANNKLVTDEGHAVQGIYGDIYLDGTDIGVTSFGELMIDGEIVDKFNLAKIDNMRDLRKTEAGLYKMEDGIEVEADSYKGVVLQGQLEKSNVDSIKEMVEMMTLYRGYESNQRLLKAYDETADKAVNEIGRV